MRISTKKLVLTSMLAALCCVATIIIKVPSPMKGYLNLGDCVVLLSGFILSPLCGFLAAGIGCAIADVFSGYVVYAPVTFIIKGLMALIMCFGSKILHKKSAMFSKVISAFISEIIMVLGYFIFEGFLYGFIPSAVNIPANFVQGVLGLIIGVFLIKIFKKYKITTD